MSYDFKIFSGRSNRPLAEKIVNYIARKLDIDKKLGQLEIKQFSDGELWVKYGENIRGSDVYLIQSTIPPAENLVELLIMIDAARRASAKRITAVIPYFGYARQDRKDQPRVSITAKLVANLITEAGADRVITMDLHTPQIQGFFDIPFDHLYGSIIFVNALSKLSDNLVVASPDVGGIKMARSYAKKLNAGLAVSDKRRPRPNVAEIVNIIGEVDGKDVLLVDDIIDTAGTFANTVKALKANGALRIYAAVTHPILSGPAIERILGSDIEKLFVLDTIGLDEHKQIEKIEVLSASEVFAEAILRINKHESISSLFDLDKNN
ncbi:MAG: ribose-phosphate pyrophosphokinase [Ignavibacteriaceae bacterium]|nr:ribose-phosphate pyrophosphokinase [Ignavibacteriaceae bacterium]